MNMDKMGNMMGIISMYNKFKENHPKASNFLHAVVRRGVDVGSVVEITITYPNGEKLESSIRIQESDAELIRQIKEMKS